MSVALSGDALEAELRRIGAERYHDKHPFHQLLHGGALSFGQVQAWALNRYCYQAAIPRKDAARPGVWVNIECHGGERCWCRSSQVSARYWFVVTWRRWWRNRLAWRP